LDHACHQRCSAIQGESQARTARSARGQPGPGGGGAAAGGPPLSAAGFRLRCRIVVLRRLIVEPGVPAEAERAVDQGLVAADGDIGADLEIGPAQLVLDLLITLLDPVPDPVDPPVMLAGGAGSAASSFSAGARSLEVVGEQQAAGPVAVVVDDLQWADRRSVEALAFMLRRLSVDPVLAVVTYRGPGACLCEAAQRLLASVDNRLHVSLGGLRPEEVAALAAALTAGSLDEEAVQWLHQGTGGYPLYLRTVLSRLRAVSMGLGSVRMLAWAACRFGGR